MRKPVAAYVIAGLVFIASCARNGGARDVVYSEDGTPFTALECEKLPDLNIPRVGHILCFTGGELVAVGGHTDGFILTPTAEYLKGGEWHLVDTYYPHEGAFVTRLENGDLMTGGGCAEAFGIGTSWGVETYSPESHSFKPLTIMDRKRAFASAANLGGDIIAVSGNWQEADAIELYTPGKGFQFLKNVTEERSRPVILPLPGQDALVFSSFGIRADSLDCTVDRLKGEPFEVPLLKEWPVFPSMVYMDIAENAIGTGQYLLAAVRKEDGQAGIIRVSGETFSLLETDTPIPMKGPFGDDINWQGRLYTDRDLRCTYMVGADWSSRMYIVRVNYDPALDGGIARINAFFTPDANESFPLEFSAALVGKGRIAVTGGSRQEFFNTFRSAFILHTEDSAGKEGFPWDAAGWIVAFLAAAGLLLSVTRKRKPLPEPAAQGPARNEDLMSRIYALMEDEKPFLKPGLKKADVAAALGTNVTYISACINTSLGCSFPEFVSDYRIRHAKQLMAQNPGMRLSDVGEQSGFASEQSFYRTFKERTGQTPQEWKNKSSSFWGHF